jgi:hypothetical protein
MLEKDKCLKKINLLIIFFIICFSKSLVAENISTKLINYNKSLKHSSALFIQTNGESIEEGVIYFGDERIKIDYIKPTKLTLILSEKKGVYINHELKESQYFNTNKSYVRVFFKIFNKKKFTDKSDILVSENTIEISESVDLNNNFYNIKIIYENNPIKLRKIKILNGGETLELGFFNYNIEEKFRKNFFSMVDPYLH